MVKVLIPSYKEGPLLASAIRSARVPGVDQIIVFDGPIDEDAVVTRAPIPPEVVGADYYEVGVWKSDAHKRSDMLRRAKKFHASEPGKLTAPLWILWLDADEILLYGEYLTDLIHRADAETGAGGFALRLVELDGSVVKTYGRIVRGDLISSYVMSIANVKLISGLVVSLPNVPICKAGGVPVWTDEERAIQVEDLATLRPPLMGEPHILHRAGLRDPSRGVQRQSDAEAEWFTERTKEYG
jgi:hypothetical protein